MTILEKATHIIESNSKWLLTPLILCRNVDALNKTSFLLQNFKQLISTTTATIYADGIIIHTE